MPAPCPPLPHRCLLLAGSRCWKEEPACHCHCPWLIQAWGSPRATPALCCKEQLFREPNSTGDRGGGKQVRPSSTCFQQGKDTEREGGRGRQTETSGWKEETKCHHYCPQQSLASHTTAPNSPQLEQGKSSSAPPSPYSQA